MATPRKSVSTKQPAGETEPEKRWSRNPAVIGSIIVAIIGGIFAISVAFIQHTDPNAYSTPKMPPIPGESCH
jgi:hypothetical protein